MQRVIVGGISGCGKSTMARRLAARFDLPYVEMDALFHGPGWVERPTFLTDVDAFVATARWVTDSDGYADVVGDRVWERADTFVWLDYSRAVVMSRVVRRSFLRALGRRELWNGNREDPRMWLRADHPIRWAWSQHAGRRRRNDEVTTDPRFGHLDVVRLRSPTDAVRWLGRLPRPDEAPRR